MTIYNPTAPETQARAQSTQTREELHNELTADGYELGKPRHVHPDAVLCDQQAAAESNCVSCGAPCLLFLPYRRNGSYRAIAWCFRCEAAFEL